MQTKLNKTIANILEILNKDLSPEELLQQVGTHLHQFIPFDRFSLSVAQLRYWFFLQNQEVTTKSDFSPYNATSSASTHAFIYQEPTLRHNISNEIQFQYDQDLQQEQMYSDIIIPFTVDDIPIGTFNFSKKESGFYSQEYFHVAQSLTHIIALVAKNILAKQENQAIGRITQELQQANHIDDILKHILEHLHFHYDRVRVYLYDETTDSLIGRLQITANGQLIPLTSTYPFRTDPYTQQTILQNLPQIFTTNTQEHKNWLNHIQEESILNPLGNQEWAEIALKVHQHGQEIIVGKISLDNNYTQIPLIQKHLNQQMTFIRQAAIAISQAKLLENMAEQVRQRTQQLLETNNLLNEKDKLLSALQEVSHRSLSYLNQDEIIDNFAKQIIQSGILRSLMIALVDHETETVEIVRAFQRNLPEGPDGPVHILNHPKTCGTRYHLSENNITPLTARTGEMQIADSISDQRLDTKFEDDQDWDDKIAYFIPVKREDKVVAVLATGTRHKDKNLFLQHLQFMDPVFNQLGIALEHASLYQKVKKNEIHYRSLFENMQSAFAYHQLLTDENNIPQDYIFLEVNTFFEELTGLKQADIIGQPVTKVLPNIKQDPADWIGQYGQVALTGTPIHFENYSQELDRWYSVSAYSPQKGYFVSVFSDITARKQTEAHFAELLDFQAQMLDTPVVWICAFDNKKQITFWNRAAELISGYTSEEALGSTDIWNKLYPDQSYFEEYIRSAKAVITQTGTIENIESLIHCKDGSTKLMSWHANSLMGDKANNIGFLAIGLDITHRKKLETEILRLERLKALGELAAGVSHNLNNMLTGILLPATMLKNYTLPSDVLENVDDIYISAIRARDLVRQLNKSVRNDRSEILEPVDVTQVITEAIRVTRARWKDESESKGTPIRINVHPNTIPFVKASTSGLHDVLVNIIFNALDALPHGGDIDIATQIVQNNIRIHIKDNGIGMSSDTKLKVFEPFFTTKMNVGTGLGLSTAYSQITRWGGELTVESELGMGSLFCITLPIWDDALPIIPSSENIPIPPLRILVVEDDLFIRRSIERFLSHMHHLTLTDTGNQAIAAIHSQTFDLAIIDLGLPDMTGDQVAKTIKKSVPHLPLIMMTGWAMSDTDPKMQYFEKLLQKPISNPDDLIKTISSIINTKQKAE